MPEYKVPVRDMKFVREEVLDFPALWQRLPGCAEVTAELAGDKAARFKGRIDRYHLPGLHAMNLVMQQALDGGQIGAGILRAGVTSVTPRRERRS